MALSFLFFTGRNVSDLQEGGQKVQSALSGPTDWILGLLYLYWNGQLGWTPALGL